MRIMILLIIGLIITWISWRDLEKTDYKIILLELLRFFIIIKLENYIYFGVNICIFISVGYYYF